MLLYYYFKFRICTSRIQNPQADLLRLLLVHKFSIPWEPDRRAVLDPILDAPNQNLHLARVREKSLRSTALEHTGGHTLKVGQRLGYFEEASQQGLGCPASASPQPGNPQAVARAGTSHGDTAGVPTHQYAETAWCLGPPWERDG